MRRIIYCLAFILIFLNPLSTLALDECTPSELKRLKELASNVSFKYEYEIVDEKITDNDEYTFKQVYYSVTGLNLSDELIIHLKDDHSVRFTKDDPTYGNFINGETLKIEMIAYTKNLCSGKVLLNKTVKLPRINVYSLKEECQEYKKFKYCQENGEFDITEREFQEALDNYKKELDNIDDDNKLNNNSNNFSNNYWIYIYIGMGLLLIIIIFLIINKKKKKDRDL